MNTGLLGVALAVTATAPLMGLFLPPLHEVRSGQASANGLRNTAVIAAVAAGVVGVIVAAATRSPAPVVGTVVAVAIVYAAYEWALRNPVGR